MARSRYDAMNALLTDARLTPESRIVGLWVAFKGIGRHEVSYPEFASVISYEAGEKRVRAALRELTGSGYLVRSPGGRGHSDFYEFRLPSSGDTLNDDSQADRVAATEATLNPDRVPIIEYPGATLSADRVPAEGHPKENLEYPGDTLNGLACVIRTEPLVVVGGDASAQARLSPQAESALSTHSELLRGCRGSLRDYLASRVPERRQASYVHSVAGWLNGIDANVWSRPDGSKLEPEKRTAMLANALNDLAASDEAQLKRPVGDPANLRTKINILLKPPIRSFNGAPNGAQRGAPQSFDYSNATTEFRGFTK